MRSARGLIFVALAALVSTPQGMPGTAAPAITTLGVVAMEPGVARAPVAVRFLAEGADPGGGCCTYEWAFGDGSTAVGRQPGAVHVYRTGGTFTVGLTIRDVHGRADRRSMSVTIGAPTRRPAASGHLRVLQWNLFKGRTTATHTTTAGLDRLVDWFRSLDADVIGVQEVLGSRMARLYARKLEEVTGTEWYFAHAQRNSGAWRTDGDPPGRDTDGQGVAILSRLPFHEVDSTVLLVHDAPNRRAAVAATVTVGGRPVTIASAHLKCCGDGADDRVREASSLGAWLEGRFPGTPKIVLGDLNAGPRSEPLRLLAGPAGAYEDAWLAALQAPGGSAATAYPDNPPGPATRTRRSRIDYVLSSRGSPALDVLSAQVPDVRDVGASAAGVVHVLETADDEGVRPSDHNPLVVHFAVR